jgi:preprotein translocase subunit SecA
MYEVRESEEEKRKAQVGGRKMGLINAAIVMMSGFKDLTYLDFIQPPKPNGKKIRGTVVEVRTEPKIARNEMCPCGSGQKYKKCCLQKSEI